jgi:hypothetical protein
MWRRVAGCTALGQVAVRRDNAAERASRRHRKRHGDPTKENQQAGDLCRWADHTLKRNVLGVFNEQVVLAAGLAAVGGTGPGQLAPLSRGR